MTGLHIYGLKADDVCFMNKEKCKLKSIVFNENIMCY